MSNLLAPKVHCRHCSERPPHARSIVVEGNSDSPANITSPTSTWYKPETPSVPAAPMAEIPVLFAPGANRMTRQQQQMFGKGRALERTIQSSLQRTISVAVCLLLLMMLLIIIIVALSYIKQKVAVSRDTFAVFIEPRWFGERSSSNGLALRLALGVF